MSIPTTFAKAVEGYLDAIAAEYSFDHVAVGRSTIPDDGRIYYSAHGHKNRFVQSGTGGTLGEAVGVMLVDPPFDTSSARKAAA